MALDFFIVFPLAAVILSLRKEVFFTVSAAAFLVVEIYSTLPLGVASLPLFASLLVTLWLMNIFDASSSTSFAVVILLGLFAYAAGVGIVWGIVTHQFRLELLTRGGLFFLRVVIFESALLFVILGVRIAVSKLFHAFQKEKII